jgi:hypothetical protein
MRRETKGLPPSLEHQLSMYALAAGAAGVGVMALASPMQAKIVYTPSKTWMNCKAFCGSSFPLDLNHDGTVDFVFSFSGGPRSFFVGITPAKGQSNNMIIGGIQTQTSGNYKTQIAYVLSSGVSVGGTFAKFQGGRNALLGDHEGLFRFGQWANVRNKYLGLEFRIGGETHYGWARLSTPGRRRGFGGVNAILRGYAYETVANKPIITGKTKGADVITLDPVSLGALAAGASRLRRGK